MNTNSSPHFSFFDKIRSNSVYIALSCVFRVVAGLATGLVSVPSFGVLTKLVPTRVAFVTSLAEAALNGAQAFGPFLGGLLYQAGGYKYVAGFIETWLPIGDLLSIFSSDCEVHCY